MKQICAASLTLTLVVVASGCNTNDLPDTVRTLPDKQDRKMTIHAATGQQSDTRVAYEDGAVGVDGKLTWQADDRLTVVRMNGGSYVNRAADYQYNGTEGATSGPFTGTEIIDAGDSWTIYSPHTVTVNTSDGTATLPMTGQTQTADGSTSHLRNYLLLSSEGIADLNADFTLEMKGSIMKFDLSNVPAEVGKLTKLVWTVETTGGTRCLTLRFAPGAVTFADGKRTLTAYLAFMPEDMAVKAEGKFTVTLTGDKTYRAETTIDGGKTYAAGMRYTAAIDGSSMSWEEKAVMALTVKVSDDNLSFNIPFPESGNTTAELTVDWGDGTADVINSNADLSGGDGFNHTYAAAGTYTLTITSSQTDKTQQQIPAISFSSNRKGNSNASKLISIDTPLLNTQVMYFSDCFSGCTSLSSIPAGLFDNNAQVINFSSCFSNCTSLSSIPEGLFDENTLATNFDDCFFGCTSLSSIPAGLFDNNAQVTNFSYCFFNCTSLSSIPEGLFDNNTLATNFSYCFYKCTSLSSIPTGLFDNNPQVTDFSSCFFNCTSLSSIPERLFDDNTQVTNFGNCFSNCTSLLSIPSGLFDNNTLVTNFGNCFSGCTSLSSIPSGLFDKNTKVTNFRRCFTYCTSLSSIPSGLFDKNTQVTYFDYCFYKCTSLSSIPEGLFDDNTLATSFYYCFSGCTSLSSIPEGLFDNNTLATNFSYCFFDCTSLSSIPAGLFDKNMLAKNFSYCFADCTSLSSIPEGLFDKNTEATDFSRCFSGCTSLSSIPEGLFDKNTQATDFSRCFAYCFNLVLNQNIFSATNSYDRFSGKAMSFLECFLSAGAQLAPGAGGTAPDLWNYEKGGVSWTTNGCFRGTNHLSNYAGIPSDWGGNVIP